MKKNIIMFICVIFVYIYEYNICFYFCFIFNIYYKNYNFMKILYFSMVFILFKSFVKEKKLVIYEKLFDFLMILVMFRK